MSFDLDVCDPAIAPGVGTPVKGGLDYREAHMVMEIVADSGLLRALDLVEVNPTLDERNTTAQLGAELALVGARAEDHLTRYFFLPTTLRVFRAALVGLRLPVVFRARVLRAARLARGGRRTSCDRRGFLRALPRVSTAGLRFAGLGPLLVDRRGCNLLGASGAAPLF